MKCAIIAAAVLLCGGSAAFGQASFTPIPLAQGRIVSLSGAGAHALVSWGVFNQIGMEEQRHLILGRSGSSAQLYSTNSWRAVLATVNYDGTAAWGTTDAIGDGFVRRVTGATSGTNVNHFRGFAYGVSDDEHAVTGVSWPLPGPTRRAFVWDPASGPTPTLLEPVVGFPSSSGWDVSPGGTYVTGASHNADYVATMPTLWLGGGPGVTMALPVGAVKASSSAVSDTGVSAGRATDASSVPRAVKWDSAGNVHALPMVLARGEALGISKDGSVIGGYELTFGNPSGTQVAAVVWINGVRYNLQALLTSHGINLGGLTLEEVRGVSSDGRVVAGNCRLSNTVFFATLPEVCAADVGQQGGVYGPDSALDNNDFIVFIDLFFASDARADLGSQGGVRGSDGFLNNNDFIAFIDVFFNGCS